MISDLFFICGLSFLIGSTTYYYKYFIISFFLPFLFFLKFKNLKISVLVFFFIIFGIFYFYLREKLDLKVDLDFNLKYRNYIENEIKKYLPFKESNLLNGMLFGSKFEDYELKEKLQKSGILHITAVSGQNLTIMLSNLYEFFKIFSFLSPKFLFIFSNLVIFFFFLIMGFQGSVVRAGIMAFFIYLVKYKFGRIPLRRNILLLTLLIFSLIDPKLIFKDIGVQLSFLATFGILYLSPILEERFKFKNTFIKTGIETISAQIFTLPLILYYFGNYNFLSIFSNILILPVIPYVLFLGYLFLLLPLKFLLFLEIPLLKYIYLISKFFSYFGIIYFKVPLILVISIYMFLLYEIYFRYKNEVLDFRFNIN